MNAKAVAETPPVISRVIPRSHVRRDIIIEAKRIDVVKSICRSWLNDSCEKKYCSITSRHTNNSRGRVVNILSPKQNRATFMSVSFWGKLFKMFPSVLLVNTTNADMAIVKQHTSEMVVEMWVTVLKRSNVGVRRLP